MDFVKDVMFVKVLESLHRENSGSKSNTWAENRLKQADGLCRGKWALTILDTADIANIVLPAHRHGIELVPDSGLAVSAAAEVLRSLPSKQSMLECWENICSHRERDFVQSHIFLESVDGCLKHLDGLHRLLAWVLFERKGDVAAFVAGFPASP